MEIDASFGSWLRRRRKALDLTQESLAARVACSPATIRKIEGDERRPSRQIAELLAGVLEIATADRAHFLRIARGELRVDRLAALPPVPPAPVPETMKPTVTASPPASLPSRSSLPHPPTPLIGRAAELTELKHLLANPACRLLTLVGPGGIGKTRLALALAASQPAVFPHGVSFVALAPLSSPEFIVSTIANALDFPFSGPTEPKTQLLNYLRAKQTLLLLDNIEHLLDGVALLVEILEQAEGVKLLVTSRERLNLQGEWVFDLQGLPVPSDGQAEQLAEYSAVALFVERARQVHSGFGLTVQNQGDIVRICRLVEGMPLAIELAAAWVPVLSCQEIAQEIERNLDFLTVSRRDLSERQLSLRATFDHSWQLLSAEEQRIMRRISVFRGGFQRAAADEVAGASLALLSALVAKSLVRRTEQGGYDIHELMRQYAASHLSEDAQEEQTTRDRHAAWYLTLLQQSEVDLQSRQNQATRDQLVSALDNLRLAWAWATTQAQFDPLLSAAPALARLYGLLHLYDEGDAVFQRAVAAVQARHEIDRATPSEQLRLGLLLLLQAELCFFRGHGGEARTLIERSVLLLSQSGHQRWLSRALMHLGSVNAWLGAFAEARAILQECIALSRALGQVRHIALGYLSLGMIAQQQGEYAEALQWLTQALELFRQISDLVYIPWTLMQLSRPTVALGQYGEAKQLLNESWQLLDRLGDQVLLADVRENLGLVAYAAHDLQEAYQLWLACLETYQRYRDPWGIARTLNHLGWVSLDLGQVVEAQHYFSNTLRIASEIPSLLDGLDALVGMATLQAQAGASERALELVSHVLSHPARSQETKVRAERLRTELVAQLTQPQIEAVQARVQVQPFDAHSILFIAA